MLFLNYVGQAYYVVVTALIESEFYELSHYLVSSSLLLLLVVKETGINNGMSYVIVTRGSCSQVHAARRSPAHRPRIYFRLSRTTDTTCAHAHHKHEAGALLYHCQLPLTALDHYHGPEIKHRRRRFFVAYQLRRFKHCHAETATGKYGRLLYLQG